MALITVALPTGQLGMQLGQVALEHAPASQRRGCASWSNGGCVGGALGRYPNVDRDWEDLAAWDGAPLTQPSLFIAGARDASTVWLADAITSYPTTLPGLCGSHILAGAGHWIQQERPEEVNELLVGWLQSLGQDEGSALA